MDVWIYGCMDVDKSGNPCPVEFCWTGNYLGRKETNSRCMRLDLVVMEKVGELVHE